MIFQVTSVYHRPNTEAKWHGSFVLDETLEEEKTVFTILNFYNKFQIISESPDENTLVVRSLWENEEAYNKYRSEPCVAKYFEKVDEYFVSVGITAEPKVKEYIEGSFD